MNFYDVLAAEKWGGGIPTMNFFDLLFAQSISGEQWQVYEGTLPATFNANGADMKQYQIYGNTGGVGNDSGTAYGYEIDIVVKSGNLFDKNAKNPNNGYMPQTFLYSDGSTSSSPMYKWYVTEYINISGCDALYCNVVIGSVKTPAICFYDSEKNYISGEIYNYRDNFSVAVPQNAVYCRASVNGSPDEDGFMIALGSTPRPYQPYSNTTTPIYIGDEPLEKVGNYSDFVDYKPQKVVRAIKKYVLTGEESWEEITGAFASRTYFRWVFGTLNYCVRHVCTCSHFTQANITTATTTVGFDVFDSTSVNGEVLAIRPSGVQSTTLEDFKAWLAEQYAAGTPVTVWCALTVAEEADPPVPLPEIPTCEGTTVIDYAGESVAPEKVVLEYAK